MSRRMTLKLGGDKPPLASAPSKMSSDSTNSKSQSDSGHRGQKRPASPYENPDQSQKAAKPENKPLDILDELSSHLEEDKTFEMRLEAENLRLQEECRAANKEKARLEAYHWAREAITEEEKRLREIIKERDATIQSRDSRVSKLEAELKTQTNIKIFLRGERDRAKSRLRNMTTAFNQEKAAREQLETKMTGSKGVRAIGCSLARDVRFWYKNRQAEKFAQAGKYEQDAVKAAKDFNCGDASCTSCPKGG